MRQLIQDKKYDPITISDYTKRKLMEKRIQSALEIKNKNRTIQDDVNQEGNNEMKKFKEKRL